MGSKTIDLKPNQGEVWLFNPDPTIGSELGKKVRPCIVISNNSWNKICSGLVIIIPLTSVQKNISSHVRIDPPEGGVAVPSFAVCEQIRAINRERLVKKMGIVKSKSTLRSIIEWISDLICLDE